jgi:hypothetical protein
MAGPSSADPPLRLGILHERIDPARLGEIPVTYQWSQFHALEQHADVVWGAEAFRRAAEGGELDAVVAFDENELLMDERIAGVDPDADCLFVFVTHDFWAHPVRVAEFLRDRRALMVLRHHTAMRLFHRLLPEVPKVMQRPGVNTSFFQPSSEKRYDVMLSGSETPDYPVRQRLNALVRDAAPRMGWNLLDLTAVGLVSNPRSGQLEYAPNLAASKVSPTGTNQGGVEDAALVMQYVNPSPVRSQIDHEFASHARPDVVVERVAIGGITPRYLESLATGTLLIGNLPDSDPQEWYRDKMVVVDMDEPDDRIVEVIDHWIRNDKERERICGYALEAVQAGETSEHRGRELAEIIRAHV